MANLFNAVDGWLMLAQAGPAMYRELSKLAGHLKNVWTGSSNYKMNLPISDQDKESWQEQLERLEQLVAEKQEQVDWAWPLMAELKGQIVSLSGKSQTETMDDVRAVKTMSERLSALTEDVGEQQDDEEIFYDCLEEFSNEPRFELTNAEWLSTRLHHLTKNFYSITI
jgi:chromosome segregation ATPase